METRSGRADSRKAIEMAEHNPAGAITSPQNERIKAVMRLSKRRERDRAGVMVIEGLREIDRALGAGIAFVEAYHCPAGESPETAGLLDRLRRSGVPIVEVGAPVYRRIAYREESGGLVAVARVPAASLDALPLRERPLYLVMDAVEKPGNLGAVMRSADGAGADGVIVADAAADPWNPNAIRASIGTIFTVPLAVAPAEEAVRWLRARRARIIAAALEGSKPYAGLDLSGACALVVGSEDRGLDATWLRAADERIRIPMKGAADSLNVAAAAAILLYEALRQRERRAILGDGRSGPEPERSEGA